MRTMLRVQIPVESGNRAMADGRLQQVFKATLESLKPEAAYFATVDGQRGGFMIFDLADVSQMPKIAEPFFTQLNAKVEFAPVMTADDLARGFKDLGTAV